MGVDEQDLARLQRPVDLADLNGAATGGGDAPAPAEKPDA